MVWEWKVCWKGRVTDQKIQGACDPCSCPEEKPAGRQQEQEFYSFNENDSWPTKFCKVQVFRIGVSQVECFPTGATPLET